MKYTLDVFPFAQSGFNSLQNELFRKDCSPENFIDKYFKKYLNNIHLVKKMHQQW